MKIVQIISLIAVLLLTVSFANASFAGHNSGNFQITHTSLQDCDEEITIITYNTPKEKCYECESIVNTQEPKQIKPSTSLRQVYVEETQKKSTQREVETLEVNVLFADTSICDEDCKKSYQTPKFSNPHEVEERKTIVTRIMNFMFGCNKCN